MTRAPQVRGGRRYSSSAAAARSGTNAHARGDARARASASGASRRHGRGVSPRCVRSTSIATIIGRREHAEHSSSIDARTAGELAGAGASRRWRTGRRDADHDARSERTRDDTRTTGAGGRRCSSSAVAARSGTGAHGRGDARARASASGASRRHGRGVSPRCVRSTSIATIIGRREHAEHSSSIDARTARELSGGRLEKMADGAAGRGPRRAQRAHAR